MTEHHSLVDVDVEEKDIACRTHDGELIRFYCEPCGACICVVCAFQQPHHDHDVSTFSEAISRHRHALDDLLARCRDRADQLRSQLQLTARWVVDVRNAEQQVRDAYARSSLIFRPWLRLFRWIGQSLMHSTAYVGTDTLLRFETGTDQRRVGSKI